MLDKRGVTSLSKTCLRTCERRVDQIYSVGGASYALVEPILRRCTAEQLQAIEKHSPHLAKDTKEIWRILLETDFPRCQFSDYEDFRQRYGWELKERAERLEEATARIRENYAKLAEEKMKKRTVLLEEVPSTGRSNLKGSKGTPGANGVLGKIRAGLKPRHRPAVPERNAATRGHSIFRIKKHATLKPVIRPMATSPPLDSTQASPPLKSHHSEAKSNVGFFNQIRNVPQSAQKSTTR